MDTILINTEITVVERTPSVQNTKADLRKPEPLNAAVIKLFHDKLKKIKKGGDATQGEGEQHVNS